ncbi:hypothetical protein ACF0H5_005588 [Mactra antiquata]
MPEVIINSAATIIQDECKKLCKRGSGSMLQNTSYDGLINFTWDKCSKELKARCPGLYTVLEAIVSDIPVTISTKQFVHLMTTAATGLYSRFQEMSAVQYIIGLVSTNGGCSLKL